MSLKMLLIYVQKFVVPVVVAIAALQRMERRAGGHSPAIVAQSHFDIYQNISTYSTHSADYLNLQLHVFRDWLLGVNSAALAETVAVIAMST